MVNAEHKRVLRALSEQGESLKAQGPVLERLAAAGERIADALETILSRLPAVDEKAARPKA
jgi:hypothetical protein